jgi:hypothetical protein
MRRETEKITFFQGEVSHKFREENISWGKAASFPTPIKTPTTELSDYMQIQQGSAVANPPCVKELRTSSSKNSSSKYIAWIVQEVTKAREAIQFSLLSLCNFARATTRNKSQYTRVFCIDCFEILSGRPFYFI